MAMVISASSQVVKPNQKSKQIKIDACWSLVYEDPNNQPKKPIVYNSFVFKPRQFSNEAC